MGQVLKQANWWMVKAIRMRGHAEVFKHTNNHAIIPIMPPLRPRRIFG
jgi:hypothetical protein